MRVLYYDCFSGISGDMNLGAMIDLGIDKDYVLEQLSKLNVSGYNIEITRDERRGITGTKVKVKLNHEVEPEVDFEYEKREHGHNHLHIHSKDHHEDNHMHHHDHIEEYHHHGSEDENQTHTHEHTHKHEYEHVHRNLSDVEEIINNSSLNNNIKKLSMDIFKRVAAAEAKIHGKPIDQVHFHEVGALDSIIDIIGAAICIDFLKVDMILCSSVELGGGFVKCAHGRFPVPAPATSEILKGVPVKLGAVPFETTTPTGAAILAAVANEFSDKKNFTINKIGYGIGHRDTEIPNVLRVFLGEVNESDAKVNYNNLKYIEKREAANIKENFDYEAARIIECNIDDMNPELYEYIIEKLLSIGAMDVYLTPIIMKKGRPAVKLAVLCEEAIEEAAIEFILKETTTLGVRKYDVEKTMLSREKHIIKTVYGEIGIKISYYNGQKLKIKPEYEDCKRLALINNIPISKIYEEALRVIE